MLELRGLRTCYGAQQVLHDIQMRVESGAITALVGVNGAGKTTLLKTVLGLLPGQPTAGQILFRGLPIQDWTTHRRIGHGLAYVPEGREVFASLSVAENLQMGAWLCRERQVREARLAGIMALFPRLAERCGQLAGTLSGGEQQMLALGRALMSGPELLLLDEPSLGLSPRLVDVVYSAIQTLVGQGMTVLLVEQNAARSLAVAQHGYVLERGRIVLAGTADWMRNQERVRAAYMGADRASGGPGDDSSE